MRHLKLLSVCLCAALIALISGCYDEVRVRLNRDGSGVYYLHGDGTWFEYSFARKASRAWQAPENSSEFIPTSMSPSEKTLAIATVSKNKVVCRAISRDTGASISEASVTLSNEYNWNGTQLPLIWSQDESHVAFNVGGSALIFDIPKRTASPVPGVVVGEHGFERARLPSNQGFVAFSPRPKAPPLPVIVDWDGWVSKLTEDLRELEEVEKRFKDPVGAEDAPRPVMMTSSPVIDEAASIITLNNGAVFSINYKDKRMIATMGKPTISSLGIVDGIVGKSLGKEFGTFVSSVGNEGLLIVAQFAPDETSKPGTLHIVKKKVGAEKVELLSSAVKFVSPGFQENNNQISLQVFEEIEKSEMPEKKYRLRTIVLNYDGKVIADFLAGTTDKLE